MMRGFAVHRPGLPHHALGAVDQVIQRLRLVNLATAVYLQISTEPRVTWSNAGHPAPVLVGRDGTTSVLDDTRDPALGVAWPVDRASASRELPPGATVLVFTDGLFERRGIDLDECLARLLSTISAVAHLPIEEMCDELLRFAPHDDDVALVAFRARPAP